MTEEKDHPQDLKQRTKQFALRILRLYSVLPKSTEAQVLGKQVLRSGTSVGAHYREVTRSRSTAEFVSKIEGGLQALKESKLPERPDYEKANDFLLRARRAALSETLP